MVFLFENKLKKMFGDISGMMGKLKDAQQKVEATKKRLNTVLIDEVTTNETLKITVTANSQIKAISIDESLLEDKEELEDYLILTINKALKRARDINEHELAIAAKDGMPNIPWNEYV
ncbi:YbaB/EbfC family nucleoid-associated protein [Tenacibaculum haliotis]|uniref:YbaB/EbfC family nucleoid-associated protein n=1 Tax=Tenacibaculum haliotis TaxID=1888914 RepID=UPI00289DF083|nr:YbaB/EbfC family nucleoid-associated protein [Tenacibaculum haliotis]